MYAGFLTNLNCVQLVSDPSVWQKTNYMRAAPLTKHNIDSYFIFEVK